MDKYKELDKDTVLFKLEWMLNISVIGLSVDDNGEILSSERKITDEDKYEEREYRFLKNKIHFLQKNNLTTRVLLKENEEPTKDFELKVGDLTEEGFYFYFDCIEKKWDSRYSRAKDKDRAIDDLTFIEKKLKEFREKISKETSGT